MVFPYTFSETFETGTKGNFDSETDTERRLNFVKGAAHLGAYGMVVDLSKGSADAYLQDVGFATAANTTSYLRFMMKLEDVTFGAENDEIKILVLLAVATEELQLVLVYRGPEGIVLELRDPDSSFGRSWIRPRQNEWVCVELSWTVDNAGANDGRASLMIDGHKASVAKMDQGAFTIGRIGAMGQTGDIEGKIYFDHILVDNDRLMPCYDTPNKTLTMRGWACLGPCEIEQVRLIDGGSSNSEAEIYDTDELAYSEEDMVDYLAVTTAAPKFAVTNRSYSMKRGCYVKLTGTNSRAIVRMGGHSAGDDDHEGHYEPFEAEVADFDEP
jgi:hypothetical protein